MFRSTPSSTRGRLLVADADPEFRALVHGTAKAAVPGCRVHSANDGAIALDMVENVATTDSTVLILGESGTGKELVARAIHSASPRRYMPIVPVSCGALPDSLMESELFGHEKGAFTGAQYRRKGKLELSDGGTLFLDEIAEISRKSQVDLLRVLEERAFTRLGGQKAIRSDFRVIAATHRDL